jgi:hypothetical protein
MNPTDFTTDSPGKLVPISGGAHAFVPHSLPPTVPMDSEAVQLLAEACQALGLLQGLVQSLPSPQILERPSMRREAELSSRIEGTYANQEELVLFELDRQTAADKPDVREVWNYVAAFEYGLKRLQELPVSLRFIRRASYPTAELLVRKLVKAGILNVDKSRRRNRVFHASEILKLAQQESGE